jgi:hypothetical protein
VEAQALRSKGWSITAIATHLGHDRKTIRAYLNGERRPGERKPARPEALEEFVGYCRQRLADDPHLWSTTLFDEVVELGYEGSYQAFTAGVRRHELRPRWPPGWHNRPGNRRNERPGTYRQQPSPRQLPTQPSSARARRRTAGHRRHDRRWSRACVNAPSATGRPRCGRLGHRS